ncbi:zinc finger FYVE domain-containing protein 1-like isoform X3 [Atheta coriaria]|uniref:zinc finger FYVE domain-containing protein 1-like isoform X3 n=1 Tax=Dalotia coriaria TaxID=877792 RepID=UPI0031F3BA29
MLNHINATVLTRGIMDNNTLAKQAHKHYKSPIILESLDNTLNSIKSIDIQSLDNHIHHTDLTSLDINADEDSNSNSLETCFLLLDEQEQLRVKTPQHFISCLRITDPRTKVKVVAIFGNTGEGKSYTLNQTFFHGQEVFRTSAEQGSCTLGVWAAYDPVMQVIVLDTEGLLGVTRNENRKTRLLLKVLAVSDIIIYRTRSERLHRDMYTFLGGASKAYKEHFQAAIQQVWRNNEQEKPPNSLGPSVLIFHETIHTNTLQSSAGVTESPEDLLRARFAELNLECDSFSSIKYIGLQTKGKETSFHELKTALQLELENTTVRSKRHPEVILKTLKGLNDKFSSEIKSTPPHLYLKEYFTCQTKCQSCNIGCSLSMGHCEAGEPHTTSTRCKYQHQYENCVYLCKQCHKNGQRVVVKQCGLPKESFSGMLNYMWSGYEIECRNCGIIYRSRQRWFGNESPEERAVIAEIVHIWPGERNYLGTNNSAQRVVDGVTMITDAVGSVMSQPTKVVSNWVTDIIAPSYWRPNNEITECHKCKIPFAPTATKHHCRECGEGFCEACSSRSQPVPSRGWMDNVRVCDDCYKEIPPSLSNEGDDTDVRVRKYGEVVASSISAVASALEIPKDILSGFIKDSVRPAYWTPDSECLNCEVCSNPFGRLIPLHHCRECGKGVCDDCSVSKKPVPLRGWHEPVRVCDNCCNK